jgi:hypothetical protein
MTKSQKKSSSSRSHNNNSSISMKKKSLSHNSNNNSSINNKSKSSNNNKTVSKSEYARVFIKKMLESVHMIKLYHWKTKSYATHKATDGLHGKLGELVDQYVEILIGKVDLNLNMSDYSQLHLKNLKDNNELEAFIKELITFLLQVHKQLDMEKDVDLLTLRDEIISELNQFLYLLRLK